jgi:serine/threonine-protein kinase RsbW
MAQTHLETGMVGSSHGEGSGPDRSRARGRGGLQGRRPAPGPKRHKPVNGHRPQKLVFTFFSDYEHGRSVQEKILTAVEKSGFVGPSYFAIKLALEEALVNAIKHGNRLDPHKKVHVEAKVSHKKAEICIEDEGPGFERCAVPDPTAQENLTKCSGRGILLIEAYMNEVHWDRGGRRLRMVKKNEDAA